MKSLKVITGVCALFLAGAVSAWSQSIPVNTKIGKISYTEAEMLSYSLDTSAVALVLCEDRNIVLDIDSYLRITKTTYVHERIKILKEEGKSYADYKIPYYRGDDPEIVNEIKVSTYNVVNGVIQETKLARKYIFNEKATSNLGFISFSAPEVKVGSVIEVSYKIESPRYWEIGDIVFQRSIPVNFVEVKFDYVNFFYFNKMARGFLKPTSSFSGEGRTMPLAGYQSYNYTLNKEVYSLKDAPALKNESYSFCPSQYRAAISYELSSISIPGQVVKNYSLRWENVDDTFRDSPVLKRCHDNNKHFEGYAKAVQGIEDEKEVIAAVRNAVLKDIKWDEKRGMVPQELSKSYKEGIANAASINAVVASALNHLGYTTSPVLIKRRSSGFLASFYVSTEAFDTFILQVKTPSGQVYYLDAATKNGYVNVLPIDFLVANARLLPIDKSAASWVDLSSLERNMQNVVVTAKLQEDGLVSGDVKVTAYNETAYSAKSYYARFSSDDEVIEDMEKDDDVEILSLTHDFSYSPEAVIQYSFEQENVESGEFLYIKPFVTTFHSESSFRNPTREIPIEFPYKENITYQYTLEIPEGYVVDQLPASSRLGSSAMNSQAQIVSVETDPHHVTIRFTYRNNSILISQDKYQDVRAYWEQICNLYKSTIVLRKI